ncbi:MAG: response regulator [Deltaproteobacteria bacterium]|nr:response regulator [Deltaproteobacteria bacterium]
MQDQDRGSQRRILVVDQEEWCRAFLSSVIKLLGFEDCTLANTVAEALAALEASDFDLVITDHRQPDYQQLLESARLRHPATRFIVMLHQRNLSLQFFYLKQVDIVYKPLCLDEIARKIRYAMHQKTLRQAEEELRRQKQAAFRIFLG